MADIPVLQPCCAIFIFCRTHFYKIIVSVVLIFLCIQYLANILVYKHGFPSATQGFQWMSNAAMKQVMHLLKKEELLNSTHFITTNNLSYYSSKNSPVDMTLENSSSIFKLDFKTPVSVIPEELPVCPLIPPKLVGPVKVLLDAPSFQNLEELFPDLQPGGRYTPPDCIARHKVAIIIPYRDREEHLRIFLHNIHPILQRQLLDYGIYIVEEVGNEKFNRALLLNIGYAEALKQYDYQCFIFHDVDLIPEDDRNLYTCPEQPRHMSVAVDTMGYRLPYKDIFGGVCALSKEHMEKTNGFSNEFWGWGGEDDDMSNRIRYHNYQISRYPTNIARYKMLRHKKDQPNPDRYQKLYRGKLRYKSDGINNLKYDVKELVLKKLYTWILADVTPQRNRA